jgi:hypothetical protein
MLPGWEQNLEEVVQNIVGRLFVVSIGHIVMLSDHLQSQKSVKSEDTLARNSQEASPIQGPVSVLE